MRFYNIDDIDDDPDFPNALHRGNKSVEDFKDVATNMVESQRFHLGLKGESIHQTVWTRITKTIQDLVPNIEVSPRKEFSGQFDTAQQRSGFSTRGFVMLPSQGPGWYGYNSDATRWGTPKTIQALETIFRTWHALHPNGPRIGVGDISLKNGGPLGGHKSHRIGMDADIRICRNDGREEPTDRFSPSYSQDLTQQLIDLIANNPVSDWQYIFFNDPNIRGFRGSSGEGIQSEPNHDNHIHVRFR